MSITTPEIMACVHEDDRRPLAPYRGRPLDEVREQDVRQSINPTPTRAQLRTMRALSAIHPLTVREIAKKRGITERTALGDLEDLELLHLAERTKGAVLGYARGRKPDTWHKARGSVVALRHWRSE